MSLLADCMDVQADLDLRCPNMPTDTFLHDAAHIGVVLKVSRFNYSLYYSAV